MSRPAVFDGHNDLLSCLWAMNDAEGRAFLEGWDGAISLPACRAGGFAGGFFAMWVPGKRRMPPIRWPPIALIRRSAWTRPIASRSNRRQS
ncbi:hypothetical protein ACFSHQ_08365 [Gemmobacter lanyuensis]